MTIRWVAPAVAVPFACAMQACAGAGDQLYVHHYENVLGTSLELRIGALNQYVAQRAVRAALAEIGRQSRILSAWDPASEFSRWAATRGRAVAVSRELFNVLDLFDHWRTWTNGALNAGARAVIDRWTMALALGRTPTAAELEAGVGAARQTHWVLDRGNGTATRLSDTSLVLASFAKSYIIDGAAEAALLEGGVHSVVLNAGGDIVVRGTGAESIAIANPKDDAENAAPLTEIRVRDRAVATSGNYRRGFNVRGEHYSHIVDPRTGQPAGEVISSTVVAKRASDAGALATAFSILSRNERRQLATAMPDVEYLLVEKNGVTVASAGWRALETRAGFAASRLPAQPAQAAAGQWDPTMELSIDFELPLLGGPAKRPFVAIWIEDGDRFPVRTLALWYHEDRYLTEMKAWYRADRLRSMSETTSVVRTVGSATRPPGKYTVKWDGKDNDGKPVKAGMYTVFLEVSREHGTYQLLKQEMNFTGTPQRVQLPAGSEIAAASFDYHKLGQ